MTYNIILQEDTDTIYGTMKKGDIIDTVFYDNPHDVQEYININYTLEGIKARAVKI